MTSDNPQFISDQASKIAMLVEYCKSKSRSSLDQQHLQRLIKEAAATYDTDALESTAAIRLCKRNIKSHLRHAAELCVKAHELCNGNSLNQAEWLNLARDICEIDKSIKLFDLGETT